MQYSGNLILKRKKLSPGGLKILTNDTSYKGKLQQFRGSRLVVKVVKARNNVVVDSKIEYDCFYGGILYEHFGHFVLESLSRLSLNSGKRTVVFLSMHQKSLLEYQRRIIDWLMPDVRVVIGSSFHLSNVEIVSPEYIIPNYYTNHHSDFLTYAYNSLATNLPRSKKIWLSRSRLSYSDGRVVGERVVECFLAKHGWEILHPQNLNFFDLLVAIKHAKHIAGFQGSAFHNLIFVSGSTPTITIFSFERNPNYETISKTNLHSYYLKDIQASSILGYRSRKTYLLSNLTMNFPDGLSLRFSYRGFKFLPFKRICFNLSLIFSSLRRTLL